MNFHKPPWANDKDLQANLKFLEKERLSKTIPARQLGTHGKRIHHYDDWFLINYANQTNAVIISNDNFRDIYDECVKKDDKKNQKIIKENVLSFIFVDDTIVFPQDPLGRGNINIDEFLLQPVD